MQQRAPATAFTSNRCPKKPWDCPSPHLQTQASEHRNFGAAMGGIEVLFGEDRPGQETTSLLKPGLAWSYGCSSPENLWTYMNIFTTTGLDPSPYSWSKCLQGGLFFCHFWRLLNPRSTINIPEFQKPNDQLVYAPLIPLYTLWWTLA